MRSGYRGPSVAASDKFESGGALLRLNGLNLEEGDGAFVSVVKSEGSRELKIDNVGEVDAEFVLFEMDS